MTYIHPLNEPRVVTERILTPV